MSGEIVKTSPEYSFGRLPNSSFEVANESLGSHLAMVVFRSVYVGRGAIRTQYMRLMMLGYQLNDLDLVPSE